MVSEVNVRFTVSRVEEVCEWKERGLRPTPLSARWLENWEATDQGTKKKKKRKNDVPSTSSYKM